MGYTASPHETDRGSLQTDAQDTPCKSASRQDQEASDRDQDALVQNKTTGSESSGPDSPTKVKDFLSEQFKKASSGNDNGPNTFVSLKSDAHLPLLPSQPQSSLQKSQSTIEKDASGTDSSSSSPRETSCSSLGDPPSPASTETSTSCIGSDSGSRSEDLAPGAVRGKKENEDDIEKAEDKGKAREVMLDDSEQEPAQHATPPRLSQNKDDIPWGRDPERPPQKLPIRFVDCVGRHFIWPWKKARAWKPHPDASLFGFSRLLTAAKGARKLIEAAFVNIDGLRPHVLSGRYDLTLQDVWLDQDTAATSPALNSYASTSTSSSSSSSEARGISSSSSSSSTGPAIAGPSSPALPSPPAGHPSGSLPPRPVRGAIILPELWDDIIEPGMMIKMLLWPGLGVGRGQPAGQPAAVLQQSSQLQPPPPVPPLGIGWPQPRRHMNASFPVGFSYRVPRGKTRKRQDGL